METVVETLKSAHEDQEPDTAESELVGQLRQELAEKAGEYTAKIAELTGNALVICNHGPPTP